MCILSFALAHQRSVGRPPQFRTGIKYMDIHFQSSRPVLLSMLYLPPIHSQPIFFSAHTVITPAVAVNFHIPPALPGFTVCDNSRTILYCCCTHIHSSLIRKYSKQPPGRCWFTNGKTLLIYTGNVQTFNSWSFCSQIGQAFKFIKQKINIGRAVSNFHRHFQSLYPVPLKCKFHSLKSPKHTILATTTSIRSLTSRWVTFVTILQCYTHQGRFRRPTILVR